MIPIFAWISTFYGFLIGTSEKFRNLIMSGFDEIREHLTSKTTTPWDDFAVNLTEWIALGQYQTTGTGKTETIFAEILEKAEPYVRGMIYDKLIEVRNQLAENSIEGDEQALDYLIEAMFPTTNEDYKASGCGEAACQADHGTDLYTGAPAPGAGFTNQHGQDPGPAGETRGNGPDPGMSEASKAPGIGEVSG
jgi:hypothetical protein